MDRDLADVEAKWSDRWAEAGAYEPEVDDRPKFFATYPYSYMNSDPHVGHSYTMLRVDLLTRYQRMQGRNALFPYAFHVTGTPLVAAADRIAEGEESQIRVLRQQGIPEEEISDFEDPWHFAEYFMPRWKRAVDRLGLGIDWRRSFHTTERNPHYDTFIRWQFTRLKEDGYVRKGSHPVIWCPTDEAPIADHDRYEGEGEVPEEWALIQLELDDGDAEALGLDAPAFLVAATKRPETMFGQTNVWVDPDQTYAAVTVDGETWLCSPECAEKLPHQVDGAEAVDVEVEGADLIGLDVHAPALDGQIPVLPLAEVIDPEVGTGIVTSVPSDAPVDYVGLRQLQDDPQLCREHGLDPEQIQAIEPITIIDTPGYGDWPARDVVEEMGIEDAADERIEAATEEVYEKGFYEGAMAEAAGEFAGQPVQQAKDAIWARLEDDGRAATMYEPSDTVICRCLTEGIVKMVRDQWFIAYGDEDWKADVHDALDDTELFPESVRSQFEYVVDWLNDWACVREQGLGTRLPWDEDWIVESLSDSTIYMAYYTFAHILQDLDPDDLRVEQFDYVLLGEGDPEELAVGEVTADKLEAMRESFSYWYPMDFRNSGKDLVQNHLTFMLFNHVALFPEEQWPEGIGVNGWVMVEGEKMSKSKGNFITLEDAIDDYGTSGTRLALAHAGEGLDDPNFEVEFAEKAQGRLAAWLEGFEDPPKTRSGELSRADRAYLSKLQRAVATADTHMAETRFRSALQAIYFDLRQAWNWYNRRVEAPHEDVWAEHASAQIRMMAPFVPHVAEEAWEAIGGDGLVVDAAWPGVDPELVDEAAERGEDHLQEVLDSTREILEVTGIEPSAVHYYVAPDWKRVVFETAAELALDDELAMNALMERVMDDERVQPHGKSAPDVAQAAIERFQKRSDDEIRAARGGVDEQAILEEARAFLEATLDCDVHVHDAGGDVDDPAGKADEAVPGRPGIYVED